MSETTKTKDEKILELMTKVKDLELKCFNLHNENQMYRQEIAPDAMAMKLKLDIEMKVAETFIASGAFPNIKPAQAYVLMQAGAEMGLGKVESLQSLYITPKGKIEPYGKGTINLITRAGYHITFLNETPSSVDVRVWNDDRSYDYTEHVTDQDQVIKNGKAIGFAKKNKMRFHGAKMHLSFRLAHLIKGTADLFTGEFLEWKEEQKQLQAAPVGMDLDVMNANRNRERLIRAIQSRTGQQLINLREQAEAAGLLEQYEARVDELEGVAQQARQSKAEEE